jgi:hypothetical protein
MLGILMSIICVGWCAVSGKALNGWELPMFPPDGIQHKFNQFTYNSPSDGKFIPRNVWVAVRNSTDKLASHMVKFIERNHKWNVHIHGNSEKDLFMSTYFANTSVNWVYNLLNPAIGCARPEIWRLSVLYLFGGFYIDDDANINTSLDEIVQPADKFIVGKEPYDFDDRCYIDSFMLSNHSMNVRFGEKHRQDILGGRFFLNWAMFAAPKSPVIERIFSHIITLIKSEYTGRSKVKMGNTDHRGKLLMCCTTHPITHSLRELMLDGKHSEEELGIRVVDTNYKDFGGDMKAWYNDYRADHWVKVIQKHNAPHLLEYAAPPADEMSGQVLRGAGHKSIYLISEGRKHGFNDFGTFMAMNFTLDDVRLVPAAIIDQIPLGAPVPPVAAK